MSDPLQIKTGQVGKVLRFRTGIDISTATTVRVRIRRSDTTLVVYPAVKSLIDITAAELTITAGMFDVDETISVDLEAIWATGKTLRTDFNLIFEIGEL